MDIVANVDGLRIVLEAETGFNRKAQAIKDADARLRQGLTVAVFAVCYPQGATEENMDGATLTWTLRLKAGEPAEQWATGNAAMLARAVQQTPDSLSGADKAAQKLSDALDAAVGQLSANDRRKLAEALDLPANRPGTGEEGNTGAGYRVAAKRGLLVVATAILFHHRLQGHFPVLRPYGYVGEWPPASPAVCAEQSAIIDAFQEAWAGILAVDYRPVFQTGRVALGTISANPDNGLAIRSLARVVGQISEDVTGLRHDLLGRIFHRVLDTARYDGSFYTSTAAAVLLASLAIREQDANWIDVNAVANLRICDPACGTGTLLMAAAERIRDLRNAAGKSSPEDEEALGLALVEDVFWGYDVNLTATHMAASTLGMLAPKVSFGRMNIHRTLLGMFDGSAYLGSLEFLDGQVARLSAWPSMAQSIEDEVGISERPPKMNVVIMNPPFTRDSLRHDQFSYDDELALKEREKEILGDDLDTPWYYGERADLKRRAARLHSSGGPFVLLADELLMGEAGTLALILPSVVPTAPGNLALRQWLARQFHVDTIIASHDPNRIFFSENTSIGEILLICRRWDSDEVKPPTRIINLARNPATPMAAIAVATQIEGGGGGYDFTVQQVNPDRIERGDWGATNFLSPFLVESYRTLCEGSIALSTLAEVGPAGQRIRDAYTYQAMPSALGRRALWHHKTGITRSMLAETDVYIESRDSKEKLADRYWAQRSRLLLPHRLRLNLARVAAAMLPEAAVGSLWTPCRPHDPDNLKALCLYLNSTPGLLSLLGGRDNRAPSYPSFSLDTLRSMPVPDLTSLTEAEREILSGWFDWLQHESLQPFPSMADDPVRAQIDDAVIQALGLDSDWVATVRRELSREPSITDQRTN